MSNEFSIRIHPRPAEPAKFERDGRVSEYYKQWAVLTIDGMDNSFEFSTDEPLPPGPATLDIKSFSVTNGRLSLSRPRLIPLAPARSAPKPSASTPAA